MELPQDGPVLLRWEVSNYNRLLYSIFGLRVPDDGTVTSYREIKLKMGFCVVHCWYYDKWLFTGALSSGTVGFSMGQIRGMSTCRFSKPSHTLNIIRHYSSTVFIVVNLKL